MTYIVYKLSILQNSKNSNTSICKNFQYTYHFEFSTDIDKIIGKLLEIKILQFLIFHIIMTHLSLFSIAIIMNATVNSNSNGEGM